MSQAADGPQDPERRHSGGWRGEGGSAESGNALGGNAMGGRAEAGRAEGGSAGDGSAGGGNAMGGRADAVFAALADPTRRRLLDELSEGGPRSATELAPGYAMSRQAVVKHLGVLADAGLVTARRDGRDVRYQLEPDSLADATAWLAEVGLRWDRRLDALRRHLTDRAGGTP